MDAGVACQKPVEATPASAGLDAAPYVHMSGVAKTYRRGARETHALERVDLSIREGEFLAIVGPSGCGKSTLLRLVAGLLLASTGEVRVDGRIVDGPQTNLGIVF
jgi:NitT/TauT family transport system ATP-binding protein